MILYHVILVCKYRHPILSILGEEVKSIIFNLSRTKDFKVITLEVNKDHIHILINSNLNVTISSIVKFIKQVTTNLLWKEFEGYLRNFYWKKKVLWSKGRFICTIGNASESTIRNYIRSQS